VVGEIAMKRLAWLTDIHLNFVSPGDVVVLVQQVHENCPEAVIVGGDIGEADSFGGFLRRLVELLELPIYFVLGNHDYYHGSPTIGSASGQHRQSSRGDVASGYPRENVLSSRGNRPYRWTVQLDGTGSG
jgi:predicted MPP superfamily phosphohydrolase